MKVLGPAIINWQQQREIERGGGAIFIGRDKVFTDAAERAHVGDLWWVKEPCWEVTSPKFGCPATHEFWPGSPTGIRVPDHLKPYIGKLKMKQRPASMVNRHDSRVTLVIQECRPSGFLCTVYMKNVDEFVGRKVA